jgi:glutathione synthase/RimK-type ligase-like ATP-grasp enzyme
LADEGVDVVFGDTVREGRITGFRAVGNRWTAAKSVPMVGVLDRYPSQTYPEAYAEIVDNCDAVPFGNPRPLTRLCRDKVALQRWLVCRGMILPEIEPNPTHFARALERWGGAFAKPRFGALGKGVHRVEPGAMVPSQVSGAVDGVLEPVFLQRAVSPPLGWAGVSLRLLVQRLVTGDWTVFSWVARRSRTDPVVNVARGADVCDARTSFSQPVIDSATRIAVAVAESLSGHAAGQSLVELGVDLVLDDRERPQLIEVNTRPRGRLEVLARLEPDRYGAEHVQACARPIRRLWALFG